MRWRIHVFFVCYDAKMTLICMYVLCLTFSRCRNCTRLLPCCHVWDWDLCSQCRDGRCEGVTWMRWGVWPGASLGAPGVTEQQSGPGPRPSSIISGQWEKTRVMWSLQRSWATITMSALDFDDVSTSITLLIANFSITRILSPCFPLLKEKSLNLIKLTIHTSPLLLTS